MKSPSQTAPELGIKMRYLTVSAAARANRNTGAWGRKVPRLVKNGGPHL